jgi:2-oxoglutarate/2-oxoacid ferredoxin oxidoreductase subunit beta
MAMAMKPITPDDYESSVENAWCRGCGNFGILTAVKKALVELNLAPQEVCFVSGIGQAPKLPHYTKGNVFNGLHGRTLPAAAGIKIANHALTVIGIDGDGGAYGEGVQHLLAAARRNIDMTYLVHNNQVYGLTKGQASPTSDAGTITKTTPFGAIVPLNPLMLAIASDISFVARGFCGDPGYLSGLIKAAVTHKGFALIDILQNCPSFNHVNTFAWYKQRVYKVETESYDPTDKAAALVKAQEWGDKIPIGIIYKQDRPLYEDSLPQLKNGPLVKQPIEPMGAEGLMGEFG